MVSQNNDDNVAYGEDDKPVSKSRFWFGRVKAYHAQFIVLPFKIKTKYFNNTQLNFIIGVFETSIWGSKALILWFMMEMV